MISRLLQVCFGVSLNMREKIFWLDFRVKNYGHFACQLKLSERYIWVKILSELKQLCQVKMSKYYQIYRVFLVKKKNNMISRAVQIWSRTFFENCHPPSSHFFMTFYTRIFTLLDNSHPPPPVWDHIWTAPKKFKFIWLFF